MEAENELSVGRRLTLADLWAILQMQRRVVVSATVAGLVVAVLYSLVAPRTYKATATLHVSPIFGQEVEADTVSDYQGYVRFNRNTVVKTQLALMNTRAFRAKVLERYQSLGADPPLPPDDDGLKAVGRMIEGTARSGTELVDIVAISSSPELSARIAQITAEVYRDENLAAHTEATRGALVWLEKELVKAEQAVEDAAAALRAYQSEKGLEDAESETTALGSQMTSLNEAYGRIVAERVELEAGLRAHEQMFRNREFEELADSLDNPVLVDLGVQYVTAATEQASVAAIYGEKMEQRKVADAKLARLETQLRRELRDSIDAERARLQLLLGQEESLQQEISGSKEVLLDVQGRLVGYEHKKLEYESARATYARLSERMGSLELQARTQLNNVRVAEDARPESRAASPNVPVNLLGGVLGGLVLGLLLGFAREFFDDTISSPVEVKAFLGVPFLGVIPKIEGATDDRSQALYTHREPRSTAAEAVRAIRTILELGPQGAPRRMLVTSAISAEGKTTTSVSLGIAFANLDRKVLLIDADLRRPRLHKVFEVARDRGFSDLLRGEYSPEDLVVRTEVPNLFLIPAGPGSEHPNELLASKRVVEVLDRLNETFDLLVIDSPPSVLLADARALSRYVDGVVLVVRENRTSRNLAREAVFGLEQVSANILGVAMNAVDFAHRRTSYKYHYGYGYRYDRYYEEAETRDAAAK